MAQGVSGGSSAQHFKAKNEKLNHKLVIEDVEVIERLH